MNGKQYQYITIRAPPYRVHEESDDIHSLCFEQHKEFVENALDAGGEIKRFHFTIYKVAEEICLTDIDVDIITGIYLHQPEGIYQSYKCTLDAEYKSHIDYGYFIPPETHKTYNPYELEDSDSEEYELSTANVCECEDEYDEFYEITESESIIYDGREYIFTLPIHPYIPLANVRKFNMFLCFGGAVDGSDDSDVIVEGIKFDDENIRKDLENSGPIYGLTSVDEFGYVNNALTYYERDGINQLHFAPFFDFNMDDYMNSVYFFFKHLHY